MTEQAMKDDEVKEKLTNWTKYLDNMNNKLNGIHMDDLKSALHQIQVSFFIICDNFFSRLF